MNRLLFVFMAFFLAASLASAQDTLPKFSVKNVGNNRIIIGWVNTLDTVKQISIQRSHDSLKNFKTILSVTDPTATQNGFADTKAPNDHMFYRLFIVQDKGRFYFSASQIPIMDTARATRSSVIEKTKDSGSTTLKPIIPKKPDFIPSFYIYTNKDGYVFINLPDATVRRYHVKFFEEDDNFLFEIRSIKETALTLDKTNFIHAGWFKFELYQDEKLIEKNKFYLAKEF